MYASMIPHSVLSYEGGDCLWLRIGSPRGTNLAPQCKRYMIPFTNLTSPYMRDMSCGSDISLCIKVPSVVTLNQFLIPDIPSYITIIRSKNSYLIHKTSSFNLIPEPRQFRFASAAHSPI